MQRLIVLYLILNGLIFLSCSTLQIQQKDLSGQIKIVDVQAWINMMPGGPGSFHITGYFECTDTGKCDVELEIIKVLSDNELVYKIKKESLICEVQIESILKSIKYNFYTNPGIKLNEKIQSVEKVSIKLIFNFDGNAIEKDFNDIILTRAY